MNSFSDSTNKLFGNCKVEWRIDAFSLQTFRKMWFIQSPEFTVNGYEETRWRMNLRSKLINGRNFIVFSLKRLAVDSGPKYIQLNLNINCKISYSKSICFNDKVLSLKNSSKYEVCVGSMECLSEIYKSDDLFTIVCHMIVYSNSSRSVFGECSQPALNILSRNMLDLFKSAQNFDTEFIIRDKVFLTHKAILSARNEYLSYIIDENDGDDETGELAVVKFTAGDMLKKWAMRKVLEYLYTGDIRYALEKPSFAICHCASVLEINEIETHYKPDKLVLQSTIDLEEYLFVLRGYELENSRLIWRCDTKESAKTYELLYQAKRNPREDCIPLFTKSCKKSVLARLEFCFFGQSGHLFATYIISDADVVDTDNIRDGIRELYSSHNTIKVNELRINVKLTSGIKMFYLDEYSSVSVSCVNKDIYYECLSADLETLLNGGPYVDMLIDNNGSYFWVHKCILACRSQLFASMLTTNEEEPVIVSNIDPHIVYVVLTYIYSGFLSDIMDDDVIEVYKQAVETHLPHLKSMCSDWLKLSSKTNRSIRCRALKIAEKYDDESLKKCILNYLFEKNDIFLMSRSFHSFQDVNACRFCL